MTDQERPLIDKWLKDPELRREMFRTEFADDVMTRLRELEKDNPRKIEPEILDTALCEIECQFDGDRVNVNSLVDIFTALGRHIKIVDEAL